MKQAKQRIPQKNLFLIQNRPHSKTFTIVALTISTLTIVCIILLLAHYTHAPLWSILGAPLLALVATYWYFLGFDNFLFFHEERLELWAGNSTTGRVHCLAPIGSYFEVNYLPHTHEVKLMKNSGTRYIKLRNGEQFIERFQQLLQKVVEKEGKEQQTKRSKEK